MFQTGPRTCQRRPCLGLYFKSAYRTSRTLEGEHDQTETKRSGKPHRVFIIFSLKSVDKSNILRINKRLVSSEEHLPEHYN